MESDRAVALLDINPATVGHTLVIPRNHAADIWELGTSTSTCASCPDGEATD